eukprot:3637108-Amphidinium_carterae.1
MSLTIETNGIGLMLKNTFMQSYDKLSFWADSTTSGSGSGAGSLTWATAQDEHVTVDPSNARKSAQPDKQYPTAVRTARVH